MERTLLCMKTPTKAYEPQTVESGVYQRWLKSGYFNPDKLPNAKKRKPYSIAMPPANVTGELHLGHTLYLTTQDILTRWKRMAGFATLWLPGTDHAGIATQILVERMLREQGINRYEIGRKKFLEHVWKWKEKYGERIVGQIKRMGASCDWSREHFTMDPRLTKAVQTAFLRLYKDGLVYRGERVIHWCVEDQTGISDLEVDYHDVDGTLWYIRYPIIGEEGSITVATTRPETMLGDTAVAVHPEDERYKRLIGKNVKLPIVGREIPIIADDHVDREFGTGCVKVTPAHDVADFDIGKRHALHAISVIGMDGKMTAAANSDFQGLPARQARDLILDMLKDLNALDHEEPYKHSVAYCSRSNTVIEPLLSKQWFVKTKPLAAKSLAALKKKQTVVVPERFTKVLIRWLTNMRDWNISRQLWWGHRIPVWYCIACDEPAASIVEPKTKCKKCGNRGYRQDGDTLDTWFSSGLWTFSTLGWPEKTPDLKRFHPTAVLGTAWDILFFWVARMMMFSTYLLKQVPFKTTYLHGLILDEHGKKMSKSKGTGIDPIPMMEKYGTDALRLSVIVGTTPGLDFRMTESKIAGQRNFCNKLWNVSRYVLSQPSPPRSPRTRGGGDTTKPRGGAATLADQWIIAALNETAAAVTKHLDQFQFSLAVETLQQFLWKDFADWYIEIHKVERNAAVLRHVLRQYHILLHPFAPFITEELWNAAGEKKLLMIEPWPKAATVDAAQKKALAAFREFKLMVIGLRNIKIHGAGNQALTVHPTSKIDAALVERLSGVRIDAAQSRETGRVTVGSEQFLLPHDIAERFSVWRTKELNQLRQYVNAKERLAANEKAPEHVRSQARVDLQVAKARLTELN